MAEKKQKMLKVTWVKSAIGYNKKQAKIVEALGFKKLNDTRLLPDNDSIRGSIFLVKHLLKVEEEN
jgi:large subunit ribosomal protein L30